MKIPKINLKNPYVLILVILVVILLIVLGVYIFSEKDSSIKDFSANLFTEVLGIIITVFVINLLIERRDKKEKQSILKNAYIQYDKPAKKLLFFLNNMYVASAEVKPSSFAKTYPEVFTSQHFYDSIKFIDFLKDAPISPRRLWTQHSYEQLSLIKGLFESILDKYGFVLDSKMIEGIENISGSHFLYMLSSLQGVRASDAEHNFNRETLCPLIHESTKPIIEKLLDDIFTLYSYFSDSIGIEPNLDYSDAIWADNMAPQVGNARVSLTTPTI